MHTEEVLRDGEWSKVVAGYNKDGTQKNIGTV
jgi:hypothetical protein